MAERDEPLSALPPPKARVAAFVAILLGGFPRGGYRSPVASIAQETWSIHPQMLSVWVAASELLVNWENATRAMPQHRGPVPERPPQG